MIKGSQAGSTVLSLVRLKWDLERCAFFCYAGEVFSLVRWKWDCERCDFSLCSSVHLEQFFTFKFPVYWISFFFPFHSWWHWWPISLVNVNSFHFSHFHGLISSLEDSASTSHWKLSNQLRPQNKLVNRKVICTTVDLSCSRIRQCLLLLYNKKRSPYRSVNF